MPFPKISILFCTKCKWNLRSAWYLQELLQTFGDNLREVSLVPSSVGEFKILAWINNDNDDPITIWDRKVDGGFPDSKHLKQRVKELVFNDTVSVGAHISRNTNNQESLVSQRDQVSKTECSECVD
ncbi:hypothetical protein Kpol_1058p7 [Vanderwaltozyma polyspora DSM 70294]|uniref:Rdx family-domain-containing protein n=1 Tax=Vanderwaltozyma polyspora (strain ATCC 22028 / DSM 70294 / BCRC 21397 / CBS 2163 / NBRC 10782 / NRRL Y-8283 / UCD 57-17) TaxID=436907 RepID=A7TJP1_VANPO|nr:uncharacterized protein Kpol_1058p7 [Vanderwaltozyma polyspora DSM 70294]EDO17470.1 hypothetical protein Kpol_1058p7 [Vanderwaltozyma polyspora DSM 70294]